MLSVINTSLSLGFFVDVLFIVDLVFLELAALEESLFVAVVFFVVDLLFLLLVFIV